MATELPWQQRACWLRGPEVAASRQDYHSVWQRVVPLIRSFQVNPR